MGVVGIYDARPEAMPNHGAYCRPDLQLVDDLHASGNSRQTCRGSDVASDGVTRHSLADAAQQPNHRGNHEPARHGSSHCGGIDEGEQVS